MAGYDYRTSIATTEGTGVMESIFDNRPFLRYSEATMIKLQAWHLKSGTISAADADRRSGVLCMVCVDSHSANFQLTATARCSPL